MNGSVASLVTPDTADLVKVIAYLVLGTLGLALLAGWALKRFGSPKE